MPSEAGRAATLGRKVMDKKICILTYFGSGKVFLGRGHLPYYELGLLTRGPGCAGAGQLHGVQQEGGTIPRGV